MNSSTLQHAARVGVVDGPLRGYHREWYVVSPTSELAAPGRVKVGEPREDVLWFDRRCFASEDDLLVELARRGIPRVPSVHRIGAGGPAIHGFVEGETLAELCPRGDWVKEHHLTQFMELFRNLANVPPKDFDVPRSCVPADRPADRDSAGFLDSLIRFTHRRAYRERIGEFGYLFMRLGIHSDERATRAFPRLSAHAAQLTPRPFCLLHGDLHRANFIIDAAGDVWTIDWELAMLGDPLYDLATHLYLMEYPEPQAEEVTQLWRQAMAEALPDADAAVREDLPRYLDYKYAQSVYADAVRQAMAVRRCATRAQRAEQLERTAETVEHILLRAADCLELRTVPDARAIEAAYAAFCPAGP